MRTLCVGIGPDTEGAPRPLEVASLVTAVAARSSAPGALDALDAADAARRA
jgi:hypothetical protein